MEDRRTITQQYVAHSVEFLVEKKRTLKTCNLHVKPHLSSAADYVETTVLQFVFATTVL